jgi:threonine/homoserine/homoserine lactone efflux protein
MISFIVSFFSGYTTSLVGTIIPGNLNAIAMDLTIKGSRASGLLFGLGAALVEIIYIRLTFLGIDFFISQKKLFEILQWIMIGIFFIAGVYTFVSSFYKSKKKKARKQKEAKNRLHAFLLGLTLKALNPAQFAFWISWSTYLIAQDLLKPDPVHYTLFCLGLGSATFTGYALYVYFGNYLQSRAFFTQKRFDRIVGIFLCIASLLWAARILWWDS